MKYRRRRGCKVDHKQAGDRAVGMSCPQSVLQWVSDQIDKGRKAIIITASDGTETAFLFVHADRSTTLNFDEKTVTISTE